MVHNSKQKKYVFSNVDDLVNYLYSTFGDLNPLKLQKGLYFLFAYYGAMYGEGKQVKVGSEQDTNYPAKLFDAKFEAWMYGPVIRDVYDKNKSGNYTPMNIMKNHDVNIYPEVKLFINEIFGQMNTISDLSLVDRCHKDDAWVKAYHEGGIFTIINNDDLIEEYRTKHIK